MKTSWDLNDVELLEDVYGEQSVRLKPSPESDARLIVDDSAFREELFSTRPDLRNSLIRVETQPLTLTLFVVTVLLFIGGALYALNFLPGTLARTIPFSWEKRLGRMIVSGMDEGMETCQRNDARKILTRVVKRVRSGFQSPYPMTVRVSEAESVNAVAFPGGYIYLFNGLIQSAEGPNEVAGVLAHEMAHVQRRHSLKRLIRSSGYRVIVSGLTGSGGSLGKYGQLLLQRSYTREDEREADQLGAKALRNAGISGKGLVSFFKRLRDSRDGSGSFFQILSTHPSPANRIAQLKRNVRDGSSVLSDTQWRTLRSICEDKP